MSTAQLRASVAAWQEASRQPGVLGRAGWSNVVSFRGHVASYFKVMAKEFDHTAPSNHYGTIEPALNAVMTRFRPLLLSSYLLHAKKALLLGAELEVELQEADQATLDFIRGNIPGSKADTTLIKKLDRLGLTGKDAVDYIIKHGAELVKGVDAYTIKVMRSIQAQAIEDQLGVDGAVRLMRKEFSDMSVARARSISTTEMNDAMSEAALNKIVAVGLDGKRWIISPGACPLCQANKAQGIIPVGEPFQSGHMRPPGHPGKCRCAVAGARLPKAA